MSEQVLERSLLSRLRELEEALRNIAGIAEQFDADVDFRAIEDIARFALGADR